MAKMPGLLRQRQKIDEAELELDRQRTAARLADIFGGHVETVPADPPQADVVDEFTSTPDAPEVDARVARPRHGGTRPAIVVEPEPSEVEETAETREPDFDVPSGLDGTTMVGVMASPASTAAAGRDVEWWSAAVDYALVGNADMEGADDAGAPADVTARSEAVATADQEVAPEAVALEAEPVAPAAEEFAPEEVAPEAAEPLLSLATSAVVAPPVDALPVDAPPVAAPPDRTAPPKRRAASEATKREPAKRRPPEARPRTKAQPSGKGSRGAPARRVGPGKAASKAVAVIASCPYCAVLLEPPPTSSRGCPRCRHRIVVKRIEGRVVYLTEAAVAFFEAERRRIAGAARFTRGRERWLRLAAAAGAPPERAARLVAAQLSQETVDAARALYMSTVDRSFRSAKRERRWEDASRIRREQAMALFRLAGSRATLSEAIVTLHRDGIAAELRGLGEIAKDAELVSAACCDACRADDGRIVRIAQELLAPTLPHPGCPKGLCRCRWDLTARDRTMLRRYQRRPGRTSQRAVPVAPQAAV